MVMDSGVYTIFTVVVTRAIGNPSWAKARISGGS